MYLKHDHDALNLGRESGYIQRIIAVAEISTPRLPRQKFLHIGFDALDFAVQ